MRDDVPKPPKQRLQERFQQLDQVLLLKHIRDAQAAVIAISQNQTPTPVSEDMQKFVSSLAIAWRSGEVRPTHRRRPQAGRWWRTRPDPFAQVWPVLLGWLEERPDMEAKQMLTRLQASGYGNYSGGQLRTLPRRVRVWRTNIARELVYGAAAVPITTKAESEQPIR